VIIDLKVIDTTPGVAGPFSPPLLAVDSDDGYRNWLCQRFRDDFGFRQVLWLVARALGRPGSTPVAGTVVGPHAKVLREACAVFLDTSGDTTAGSRGIATFDSGDEASAASDDAQRNFLRWLRQRYTADTSFRLQFETLAQRWHRWRPLLRCSGPFAAGLEQSLDALNKKMSTT